MFIYSRMKKKFDTKDRPITIFSATNSFWARFIPASRLKHVVRVETPYDVVNSDRNPPSLAFDVNGELAYHLIERCLTSKCLVVYTAPDRFYNDENAIVVYFCFNRATDAAVFKLSANGI